MAVGRLLPTLQASTPALAPASAARVLALLQQRALPSAPAAPAGSTSCTPEHTTTLTLQGWPAAAAADQALQGGIAALWSILLGDSAPSLVSAPQPSVTVKEDATGTAALQVQVAYAAGDLRAIAARDLSVYSGRLIQDLRSGSLQSVLATDVGLPAAARVVSMTLRLGVCSL